MITNFFINLKFKLCILLLFSSIMPSVYSQAIDRKLNQSIYIFGDSHAQSSPINKILITHQREGDLGDKIATFCNAYSLAQKYNLPFYYQSFRDSNLFLFDDSLNSLKNNPTCDLANYRALKILSETELINNLNSNNNIIFEIALNTQINHIAPESIKNLKQILQLKQVYSIEYMPKNQISIAVHIRKGNGGGQFYDGQLASEQLFEFDRAQVKYETNYDRYPFQWELDLTYPEIKNHIIAYGNASGPLLLDKVAYVFDLKFPPEQYYIDQLIKLSNDLDNSPIFAQIFTDDKDPINLVERLKNKLNKPNIKLYYLDNRAKTYSTRIAEDLSIMSQCDGLIRSQSYFARAAEMIGNHKFVIFPMGSIWQDNKRIINRVVTKQTRFVK